MSEYKLPKVLIAAPQHDSKKYCWDVWKNNIKNLTYPNAEVFIAENSESDEFSKEIRAEGFKCKRVGHKLPTVLARTTKAHEACRLRALDIGAEWLAHIETDVIVPLDFIERCLYAKKKVISGVYDIHHGKSRKAMIQHNDPYDRSVGAYRTVKFLEHEEPIFFDGSVKQVYHAGIGAIMIHRSVFEKIPFRYEKDNIFHADTFFASDCFMKDIPIFVDTSIVCKHYNSTWLDVADEFLNPVLEKQDA